MKFFLFHFYCCYDYDYYYGKDTEVLFGMCRFITVNELETAFKENNMGDDATIKEIISEVGRDHKVSWFLVFWQHVWQ